MVRSLVSLTISHIQFESFFHTPLQAHHHPQENRHQKLSIQFNSSIQPTNQLFNHHTPTTTNNNNNLISTIDTTKMSSAATNPATSSMQLKRCVLKKHDAPLSNFMKQQQDGSWTEQKGRNDCRAHRRTLQSSRRRSNAMGLAAPHVRRYDNVEKWRGFPVGYTPVAWLTEDRPAFPVNTKNLGGRLSLGG